MGWNGSENKSAASVPQKTERKSPPSKGRGLVALIVIVVGGVAAWFALRPAAKESDEAALVKPTKITEVKPQIATNKAEVAAKTKQPAPQRKKDAVNLRDPRLSPEQRDDLYEKRLREMPIVPETTNRVFRTGTEQVMGWIFTTEIGERPPPLPRISDFDIVHMQEILEMENPIRDTDSERAANAKEAVAFAKKELKQYIEKGGDPQDFLQYYRDELQQAYQKRQDAYNQVMMLVKEEPENALEYMEMVNKSLREQGIKAVQIAPRTLRRHGITPPEKTTTATTEEGAANHE